MELLEWLIAPLEYGFMIRAILASIMVGIVSAVLGSYIVLQGMAFFGDGLAHAILPGIVIAFLTGWPLVIGALLFGILAAIGIGLLSEREEIREDTAIGVVFAGSFALGVALISTAQSYATDLTHILFGNVLGVSITDLYVIYGLGLVVLIVVYLFYKEFLILAFDPTLAVVLRLPRRGLRYLLLLLIAVTIVISLQTVGLALMIALLVTPATTASLLTRRLPLMMAAGVLIALFSNISGLYLSFYLNIASGPAMVLVSTGIFLLVFLIGPRRARQP